MIYTKIVGTGSYLPEKVLTNADLEKMVDTSDQWIMERTGIKKRHILAPGQLLSMMTEAAAKRAIDAAGISKDEIDLIIVATVSSEFVTPSAACILQQKLGIKKCPAFDISAACAGFIYGLNIADLYIKSKNAKCVLLVASEALSKLTDWTDRTTCVLFGDGAGAVVLKADNKPGLRSTHIHAEGYNELLYAKSYLYNEKSAYVEMKGNELFKLAVMKLSESVQEALDYNKIDSSKIDWLVPHQANLRIIIAMAKKLNLSMDRVILTVQEHGNTSAASVPLALDVGVRDGRIKRGDTILMEAFGAGLTWGAALIDY
jgi:3-oxoacyl-[acyl-carrier-protein] synthase III